MSWWIVIRPQRRGDQAYLTRYQTMLDTLEADAGLRSQAFRQRLLALFASRQLLTFYRQWHPARQRVFSNGCAFWATACCRRAPTLTG